jgi:alkylated DNA repair dioxygenase AlkB
MKVLLPDADIEYIEGLYSVEEATELFTVLQQSLDWRHDDIRMFGKVMKVPRLQAWYSDNGLTYRYSNMTLASKPWTETLATLKERISDYCQHDFNAVLANLYRDQRDSVSWHSDDEAELGNMPIIASLSLGAARDFQLKHIDYKEKLTLSLSTGSLLIMRGDTQRYWQHCVPKRAKEIEARINLTFRKIIV